MSGLLWTGLFWTDISFAKREQMKFQKPVDSINWILWAPSINLATLTLSKFETYLYAIATSKNFSEKDIFSVWDSKVVSNSLVASYVSAPKVADKTTAYLPRYMFSCVFETSRDHYA